MAPKLTNPDEIRDALAKSGGDPVEIEDDQTHTYYVLISRDQFRDMQHKVVRDDDVSDVEMPVRAAW